MFANYVSVIVWLEWCKSVTMN